MLETLENRSLLNGGDLAKELASCGVVWSASFLGMKYYFSNIYSGIEEPSRRVAMTRPFATGTEIAGATIITVVVYFSGGCSLLNK